MHEIWTVEITIICFPWAEVIASNNRHLFFTLPSLPRCNDFLFQGILVFFTFIEIKCRPFRRLSVENGSFLNHGFLRDIVVQRLCLALDDRERSSILIDAFDTGWLKSYILKPEQKLNGSVCILLITHFVVFSISIDCKLLYSLTLNMLFLKQNT